MIFGKAKEPKTPSKTEFFSQEYWSGLLCPPPGDLLDPGIKPRSLVSPALEGRFWEVLGQEQ